MKDFIVTLVILAVVWYVLRNGAVAQVGSRNSIFGGYGYGAGRFVNFETPWGNYAGGW